MKSASLAAGKGETFVRDILKRDAKPKAENLLALTNAIGVSVSDILEGEERTVPVVGYVRAGAELFYYETADDPGERVPAPDDATNSTVAVELRGQSMGPLLDGWLVFYDQRHSPVTPDLIGELCVVGLPDDRVLIKQIKASRTPGHYHLLSNTGEPPMLDMQVTWAAKVKTFKRR